MMSQDTHVHRNSWMTGMWLLFSFKGRINRRPYWMFNLCIFVAGLMFGLFIEPTKEINKYQLLFMLWILWPSLAVQAKRWHDINKSALWLFINLIPVAGPLWALIENGFIPGTRGPNRYGADPLESREDRNR